MTYAHLPSLNALRAFEAVARNLSFKAAADELFVTPAAISHQIKQLEEMLGIALIVRGGRRIELTDAARSALPLFRQGFEALSLGVTELRRYGRAPQLSVATSPTFASRWLMPRLQRFLSLNPGVDVRLLASRQSADAGAECDIEIRFASDRPAGDQVDLLFRVAIMPMCHPRVLAGPPALRAPEDLRHVTLLHGDGRDPLRAGSTWAQWLRLAGVTGVDAHRGLQLDHSALALDAAADGLGVTLASPVLAAAELAEGKVVVAFPQALPLDNAYYLVTSNPAMARPEVAAFHRWLLSERQLQEGQGE